MDSSHSRTSDMPSLSSGHYPLASPEARDGPVLEHMSSAERRQYNKALKAMYEIVRLGSQRMEVSYSEGETAPMTETSETESGEVYLITKCSYI